MAAVPRPHSEASRRNRKIGQQRLPAPRGYAYIVRALAADNAKLDPRDRFTVDSVRTHCARHFPVQSIARATYRDILERRAQENRVDLHGCPRRPPTLDPSIHVVET